MNLQVKTDSKVKLSVIIPMLNEAGHLDSSLKKLQFLRGLYTEVIVVDGGSSDRSVEIAQPLADKVLLSAKGRSRQMNAGALQATGEVLLFLHADTELPQDFGDLARQLKVNKKAWGRFDVRLSGHQLAFRMIEFMMNHRSRLTGIATGDQGLFVQRAVFLQLDGFADIPLMEDIELCQRLKKISPPLCVKQRVTTSSRKWEREGIAKVVILMWRLRLAYFFGVRAETLAKFY